MPYLSLDSEDWERLTSMLASAFDFDGLSRLVQTHFADVYRDVAWQGVSLTEVVHQVIEEANRQGLLAQLLTEAAGEVPEREDLAALAEEFARRPAQTIPSVPKVGETAARATKHSWLWPAVGLMVVVAVVLIIRGISGNGPTPTPTATEAPAGAPTATATPSPTQTATRAQSPTETATPTQPPTGTVTPAPLPAVTPEPSVTAVGPNGMVLMYVPAGRFTMGSSDADPDASGDETPQHRVYVGSFWISRTEVTNAQYTRCVDAGACPAPRNEEYKQPEFANRPVTDISWYDANAYASWVGGRLPTEAEWEKACRGWDGRIWPWGNAAPTDGLLNADGFVGHTTDAGSYPSGVYGLFDVAGNVFEWTASLGQPYPYRADDGRNDAEAEGYRVMRGGSWLHNQRLARCAFRGRLVPDTFSFSVGFRVVVSVSTSGS